MAARPQTFLLLLVLFIFGCAPAPIPQPTIGVPEQLSQQVLDELLELGRSGLAQQPAQPDSELLQGRFDPVFVCLRGRGLVLASGWVQGIAWGQAVHQEVQRLKQGLPDDSAVVDSIELCLTHSYQPIAEPAKLPDLFAVHRGVLGLQLEYGGSSVRYAPTAMLSENIGFATAINRFLRRQGQDPRGELSQPLKAETFEAFQVLLNLQEEPRAYAMFRGNTVEPDLLSPTTRKEMQTALADWIVGRVQGDGSMPYLYYPAVDQLSDRDSIDVRQWLNTWTLARLASKDYPGAAEAYERNLRHYLQRYYRTDGWLGFSESDERQACIGALALAGLSLLEGPLYEQHQQLEESLYQSSLRAMGDNGRLRTYLYPAGLDQGQNFYPGETLLYWAVRYRRHPDPKLLKNFQSAFEFYRRWHRQNRNPAFVPWHTQAAARIYMSTQKPDLKEFIFEMNDWLLSMQQWDKAEYPDFRGQFWDPKRPEFGNRPHVSSTGVYLEGLVWAYRVADQSGDRQRAQNYRLAILRGLRSLRQHQFVDEVDLFYATAPEAAVGGLRSTVYDSAIRVDNGAHALNALLDIEATFKESDYLK